MNKKINLLSVIIPCKNQAEGVKTTLSDIEKLSKEFDFEVEVIYADGGSEDKSVEVAESFKGKINIQVIPTSEFILDHKNPHQNNKGNAVKTGMLRAKGDIRMFMDADSSTKFEEIKKLLPYFNEGYDIVMGSRYIKEPLPATNNALRAFWKSFKEVLEVIIYGYSKSNSTMKRQGRLRQFIARGGNLAFVVLLGQSFADTRCGFKAYTREAAETLFKLQTLPGFGFDTEILVIAKKYKQKIIEVPVVWYDEAEITNVTMGDALKTFLEIFKIRWYSLSGKYSKKTK